MSTEVQLPSALPTAHRMLALRPATGCLSLQQLKDLYAQRAPGGSPSSSPITSPRSSPSSSPRRPRLKSQCSKTPPPAAAPCQGPSVATSRLGRHTGASALPRNASEDAGRCPLASEEAAQMPMEDGSTPQAKASPALRPDQITSGARSEATRSATFHKSHSMSSDRLTTLKSPLKSIIQQDRELRHAQSLSRRVSFSTEVEVIVYQ